MKDASDDLGRVERRAYAKVNLMLSVGPPIETGPQAGFHRISSWFACVGVWDDISISRRSPGTRSEFVIEWAVDAPAPSVIDWEIERDLAFRAHGVMERALGRPLPVEVRVSKRIPVGGGLGGGSSDAAAVLLGLDDLFECGMTDAELVRIGRQLGSDVEFFLDRAPGGRGAGGDVLQGEGFAVPRPALVEDLGEVKERLGRIDWPVLLVIPEFGCPTGPVYKAYDQSPVALRAAAVRAIVTDAVRRREVPPDVLFNDLAEPACRVQPRLREVIDVVQRILGRRVHVSGSGSTLFVLGEARGDSAKLVAGAARLRREQPQLGTVLTRLI